jgi:hypothetical protein
MFWSAVFFEKQRTESRTGNKFRIPISTFKLQPLDDFGGSRSGVQARLAEGRKRAGASCPLAPSQEAWRHSRKTGGLRHCRPVHVQFCAWEDGPQGLAANMRENAAMRLAAARAGSRSISQRVLEIAVWGRRDSQEADAALHQELTELIPH